MDTTRKPHAGEAGAAAASKAESPVERTVLGMAPPSAPAPVSPAPPAGAAPPAAGTRAPPAAVAPIATAPLIPIAESGPKAAPPPEVPASPVSRGASGDSTLPVVPCEAAAPASTLGPAASALESLERTATTAEYLQAARATALNELAGTGQIPAPTLTRPAAPPPREAAGAGPASRPLVAPPPSLLHADLPSPASRGFEPVPPVRAPLAESLSGAWGPVADIGGSRPPPALSPAAPGSSRSRHEAAGRWLLLAAVALVSVAAVWFGGRLLSRHRSTSARTHALAATDVGGAGDRRAEPLPASTASRALLANLPAPGTAEGASSGAASPVTVVSATGGRNEGSGQPGAGLAASSESQLAATAGRHVLSGNFAEALPVYQELERAWPDNTAYAAMAKLLRARVGASSERPGVAPAAPKPTKGAR